MTGGTDNVAIPRDLVARRQWAAWRYEYNPKKGRDEKVPYTPGTERRARTDKRATWRPFPEALAAGMQGVGYMMLAEDPFTGVDLDGCRDPDTGEMTPWAQAIIDALNTYTEVSPSGKGVKLWLKARKTARHCKVRLSLTEAIETYDRARFFTVTGKHLAGTPTTIEARQAEYEAWYGQTFAAQLAADARAKEQSGQGASDASDGEQTKTSVLPDDEVITLALAAQGARGERFRRLWEGDVSEYQGDESLADMALCGILAFYTANDAEQMDRLFRRSILYRDKWERGDYRQRTVERAIRNSTSSYSGPRKQWQARQPQRVRHVYDWQRRVEKQQQRNRLLFGVADDAKQQVRQHFEAAAASFRSAPLVIALPP
ncbi:MAG TPA: hypothetical protein VFU63_15035, partial [Ktedonobacterales bacterium]|nr:hypothetical protein [Ktedonobacterales bacterium]